MPDHPSNPLENYRSEFGDLRTEGGLRSLNAKWELAAESVKNAQNTLSSAIDQRSHSYQELTVFKEELDKSIQSAREILEVRGLVVEHYIDLLQQGSTAFNHMVPLEADPALARISAHEHAITTIEEQCDRQWRELHVPAETQPAHPPQEAFTAIPATGLDLHYATEAPLYPTASYQPPFATHEATGDLFSAPCGQVDPYPPLQQAEGQPYITGAEPYSDPVARMTTYWPSSQAGSPAPVNHSPLHHIAGSQSITPAPTSGANQQPSQGYDPSSAHQGNSASSATKRTMK